MFKRLELTEEERKARIREQKRQSKIRNKVELDSEQREEQREKWKNYQRAWRAKNKDKTK